MSYLLDKKIQRKKIFKIILGVAVLIILIYFRSGIWNGLASASQKFFSPILIVGNSVGEKFRSFGSYFVSKNSLYLENQNLQSKINEAEAKMLNYDSFLAENNSLQEILGRKDVKADMVLAAILGKPNQSLYNMLIIDAGLKEGVKVGDVVFALGNMPIGTIAETYSSSSKVILFSNPGEKTQVVVGDKNIFMEIVGRGGGNFEMVVPRDLTLVKGDQVVLPGLTPYVVGIVETIISDPRDPFIKALLASPVNVQELKFVEVGK